jgi:ElaB/YqjD/DUF883 family membrane-anchored ribosome-binding protein
MRSKASKTIEAAEEKVEAIGESLSVHLKDALESARDWKDVTQSFVKKNPGVSLAAAFVLGFAISKVARHA